MIATVKIQRLSSHARFAYSLVELIVLLSVVGTVSTLSSIAVHRVMVAQKISLSVLRTTKMLDDLHIRLVDDTHRAREIRSNSNVIELIDGDGTVVEYRLLGTVLQRRCMQSDGQWQGVTRWPVGAVEWSHGASQETDLTNPPLLVQYQLKLRPMGLVTDSISAATQKSPIPSGDNLNADRDGPSNRSATNQDQGESLDWLKVHWVARLGSEID